MIIACLKFIYSVMNQTGHVVQSKSRKFETDLSKANTLIVCDR